MYTNIQSIQKLYNIHIYKYTLQVCFVCAAVCTPQAASQSSQLPTNQPRHAKHAIEHRS